MLMNTKPYYALDYFYKELFGEKIYKIALHAEVTCPNRDGKLGTRGCIFCSKGGSGEFSADRSLSISQQIYSSIENHKNSSNNSAHKYIAYFQAFTNTYAPTTYLRKIFMEAISSEYIVGLSIATRPDCLPPEVLDLLDELNQIKPVFVELGLQTIHEKTALFIRRGYTLNCFDEALLQLERIKVRVVVHAIIGLPYETEEDVYDTILYLNQKKIHGIKLQLLHILKDTDLYDYYRNHPFPILSQESYINLVIGCIERLSPEIVIHRLTGDGPRDLLIEPLWSLAKRNVLNSLHSELKRRNTSQGAKYYAGSTDSL